MNRIQAVQECLARSKKQTYLEIGVSAGDCFTRIKADFKIAVDPNFKISARRRKAAEPLARTTHYFEMTSDHFFATQSALLERRVNVAFIDGLHTYQQVLNDVNNTLAHLDEDGVILLHDCNPRLAAHAQSARSWEEFRSKTPWWNFAWCGDVWKSIAILRSTRPDLQVGVLDCDFGVGIVQRSRSRSLGLSYRPEQIEQMSFDDLARDRKQLLNLVPPRELHSFLAVGA